MRLVAVRLPSPATTVAVVRSLWDGGDAVLPLDPRAPDAAVADLLRRLRPHALVHTRPDGSGQKVTALADGVPVPDGTAAVVATSGSTGTPKGVVLSHDAMRASAHASVTALGCQPGQRWLLCLPLHHVAGLQVVVRSRLLDTLPVVLERFDVDGVAAALPDVAWSALVPTMLRRLLDAGVGLAGHHVLLGGAALDPRLRADAADAGVRLVAGYGMTETCGGCVYEGVPLPGVEVDLRNDGRIALRGPLLATGLRSPDGTIAPIADVDGWLVTNDVGRLVDGRLHVDGRADAVVVTGGENVPAEAVERVLASHPALADAAVLGVPDAEWGERVVALVVVADGATLPATAALRAHVATALGAAAAPREVHAVTALPRTSLGKLERASLPALLG